MKPTIRVSHLTIREGPQETVVASKMLYATHYFWTGLELRVLMPDESRGPGFWFVTVNRSRADGLSGFEWVDVARPGEKRSAGRHHQVTASDEATARSALTDKPQMRKTAVGVLLGLGSAALILTLGAFGTFDPLELDLYDWRMRRAASNPPDVNRDIVIVELNDTTIRDLDPAFGRWPWPRAAVSLLVDFLNRAPAKVIALDFTFTEGDRVLRHKLGTTELSGAESDDALAASVKAAPSTILLAEAIYEGLQSGEMANKPSEWKAEPYRLGPAIYDRPTITTPFPALSEAVTALGHNYAVLDQSGGLRRIPPFVRVGDRYMPSLGVAAALRGLGIAPQEVVLEGRTLRLRDRLVPLLSAQIADPVVRGATEGAVDDAGELPGAGGAAER